MTGRQSPEGDSHISRDHEITLTLTRDQFIVLMGALGNADAITCDGADLTPELMEDFTESVQNPILQDLIANLTEPLIQAWAGYGIDQAEQAGPDDLDGPR